MDDSQNPYRSSKRDEAFCRVRPRVHKVVYLALLSFVVFGFVIFYYDADPILINTAVLADLMIVAVFFVWGSFLIRN